MKRPFNPGTIEQLLYTLNEIHAVAMDYIRAGGSLAITISDPTRTHAQNAKLHAMIGEVVRSGAKWCGAEMDVEDWKNLFTAAISREKAQKETRVVPGMDGGFVVLGLHTSQMSLKQVNEMIERVYAFGLGQNPPVRFKEVVEDEPIGRCA